MRKVQTNWIMNYALVAGTESTNQSKIQFQESFKNQNKPSDLKMLYKSLFCKDARCYLSGRFRYLQGAVHWGNWLIFVRVQFFQIIATANCKLHTAHCTLISQTAHCTLQLVHCTLLILHAEHMLLTHIFRAMNCT